MLFLNWVVCTKSTTVIQHLLPSQNLQSRISDHQRPTAAPAVTAAARQVCVYSTKGWKKQAQSLVAVSASPLCPMLLNTTRHFTPYLLCPMMEWTVPVAIGEDLAADVLSNHSSALQIHEHTADGGLLGTLQLLLTHLACYCLQGPRK